jgi:hypothetical protein
MTSATPKLDTATPRPAPSASGGVAFRSSIVLALAFAVTAVVLLSNPDSNATAVPEARGTATIPAANPATPGGDFDDPTVGAAVRDWAWESGPRVAPRPGGAYDVMELWYPSLD